MPGFFEPKPKPFYYHKKCADNKEKVKSILRKRKLMDAFGEKIYNDQDRYGQEISNEFFKNNTGHGVYN
jgi:hypothetical protein